MKNKLLCLSLYLIIGLFFSCSNTIGNQQNNVNKMDADIEKLSNDLIRGIYGNFFIYPDHENTINKIWSRKENPALLEVLVKDESLPLKGRFLACVVLNSQEFTFVFRYDAKKVAEIYAQALEQNLTGLSNSWGLLYEHEDEGPIGITFIILGEASVPVLIPLLQNENPHNFYIGNEEATLGNGYNFRIKDVAAYYIGKIKNIPQKYLPDFKDRDLQIDHLLNELTDMDSLKSIK